ncbi:conserved Plasmodium protein, unknown function [Plasmodium gallinaceum]|uniref:Uncharacterized protein n=1 Tax=Plasmodium gallinaceum TaxID=5849 RepID=A0A1J1H048_PLAGA|nr:conserved Plasmodium protein, unknown function [Plasmodium gallinaceum]CRG96660.1 conserved Plasmodium protein, unknown function [Plasmodium gallinaceum]
MADKICHKLINENLKTLCEHTLPNKNDYEIKNEKFNNININCSSKCEELCNNINERLQKIKDIVHLRSTRPNVILIDTLKYIKEYIKEIEKYIEIFNNVIHEENKAYAYFEDIFNSLNIQNQNVQKIYHICSKNIVITKNNNELILQKPQSYFSLSSKFVNNLLNICKEQNEKINENNNENQNENKNIIENENENKNKNDNYLN